MQVLAIFGNHVEGAYANHLLVQLVAVGLGHLGLKGNHLPRFHHFAVELVPDPLDFLDAGQLVATAHLGDQFLQEDLAVGVLGAGQGELQGGGQVAGGGSQVAEQLSQGTQLFFQLLLLGGNQQFIGLEGVFQLGAELLLAGALGLGSLQFRGLVGLILGESLLPGAILLGLGYLALLDEFQQLVQRARLLILRQRLAGGHGDRASHGECGGLNKFDAH